MQDILAKRARVTRRRQKHADIWPQDGGSGGSSCQSHSSREMPLSLIVLCFSGLHASEIHFLCLNTFCQEEKGPVPNLYCPVFDRKHLTACGRAASSQIKYPSVPRTGSYSLPLYTMSSFLLPFFIIITMLGIITLVFNGLLLGK